MGMEAEPQPGQREGDPVWTSGGVLVVSRTDRDGGGIGTRNVPVKEKHGCPCMLDDLSSVRPRASIEP